MGRGNSSDEGDDLGDELLALAGASDKPRKKRSGGNAKAGSSKRRKQEVHVDSDEAEPESEEDESNPYPLDGKYKDELDRQNLMKMSEIDREQTLSLRLEERQRAQDKANIDRLIKVQKGRQEEAGQTVSSAAKRKHTSTGQTQEKAKGLAALAEQRRAKKERAAKKSDRDGSASPKRRSETPSTDSSDEEGQINKAEEAYDNAQSKQAAESVSLGDLEKARITRDMLAKFCLAPWFEDYVKGGWVKYMIGVNQEKKTVYRLCEVQNVGQDIVRPYKLDDKTMIDQTLELRHGKAVKCFNMDRVSNAPFTDLEFQDLVKRCNTDQTKLPKKATYEKKRASIIKYAEQRFSEADIQAMISRKNQLQKNKPSLQTLLSKKTSLIQARTLAQKRHDYAEADKIKLELEQLEEAHADMIGSRPQQVDRFGAVNERNRQANLDAVRANEEAEKERRKKAAVGAAAMNAGHIGGSSAPAVIDLSARVRTLPKIRHEVTSRSGTPKPPGSEDPSPSSARPLPASGLSQKSNFDHLASSMEIDIGDF